MNRESAVDPMRPRGGEEMDPEQHLEIARCLFRESNDALFLFDTEDHRVLDVNPAGLRLTGFSKDQIRLKKLREVFSGDTPSLMDNLVEAYRRTGFYHSREGFTLARLSGSPIPVNVSVSRMHTRPRPFGLVVARDVTERKRSEMAVRESEARYRLLIETAKVVFWSLTAQGRIRSLNPQFAAITGWTAEAWTGRPITDLISREDRDIAIAWVEASQNGSIPPPIELRIATRVGSIVILEFLPTAIVPDGASFELSGIARDVTQMRRTADAVHRAEEMDRARKEAEAADRAKSEFLASFSREIRTPMASIVNSTSTLLSDPSVAKLPPERLDDLRLVEKNGAELIAVIDEIQQLAEADSGRIQVETIPCSPRGIVDAIVTRVGTNAISKGVRLSAEVAGSVPSVIRTDPVRFEQIVEQLVANAIKFTEVGSVVLNLSTTQEDGVASLIVDVSDSGVGIEPGRLTRIFEPFQGISPDGTDGHGLGLAICVRVVKALGGRISATSVPGKGSTFRLLLPMSRTATDGVSSLVSAEPTLHVPPVPLQLDVRILLAEDNPANQKAMALRLKGVGATVQLVRNGHEAIETVAHSMAADQAFDVVLLDMEMPVVDGYEAARQLRAIGFEGKIIALTAYAMAEDREECLRIGCDDQLSKPVDWNRLLALISSGVSRGSRVLS